MGLGFHTVHQPLLLVINVIAALSTVLSTFNLFSYMLPELLPQ